MKNGGRERNLNLTFSNNVYPPPIKIYIHNDPPHSDLRAVQSVSYFRTETYDMTETIIFSKILKKHPPISQITVKDITKVGKPLAIPFGVSISDFGIFEKKKNMHRKHLC